MPIGHQWTPCTLSRTVTSLEQSGCFFVQELPPSRRYWSSQTREYTLALQTQGSLQYSNELLISSLRVWSGQKSTTTSFPADLSYSIV